MSADEIKVLAQQVYCDGMSVKRGGFEHTKTVLNNATPRWWSER